MNKEGLLIIRQVIEVCERLTDEEIEMAWKCIDKQIPEKPDGSNDGCFGCGEFLSAFYDHPNYCPNCGQKINWEETPRRN